MKHVTLLPHQVRAVEDTCRTLKSHDRCQLISACATGKTYTCQTVAERVAPDGLTVILVPTIALLGQTVASWKAMATQVGHPGPGSATCRRAPLPTWRPVPPLPASECRRRNCGRPLSRQNAKRTT